jgi:PAS domain S-box-containing protein
MTIEETDEWEFNENPFEANNEIQCLHVDDNPQFCEVTARYLKKINGEISVIEETDAQAGLDRLIDDPVDCVISDYEMPGMDGIEFLQAVRENYPNLPFILFTGRGSEDVASEAINAGVTSYLQKGNSRETYELLTSRIQQAVSHHHSQRLAQIAKDRLFNLYEHVDGFYVLSNNWTITYWNSRIANRTERPHEEVLGRSFWDVFPEATELKTERYFREAMESREPVQFEVRYDPGEYWAEVRVYPFNGGLFIHSRDITEERERKQEMERRNQILQSFASTVSHDLRNPLSVAEGRLQLAQRTGDFEQLDGVAQAHNRMRNLIDELLRLARGEEMTLSEVSLQDSATQALETVSSEDMELVVVDDTTFKAHDTQLRRVFENLYWNALKHGEADTVSVGLLDEGGVYVEDDGVGIPPEDREKVFETGYSTDEDSPGFGLHLVEAVIEMHGWDITVTEGRAGGARFEIDGIESIASQGGNCANE